MAITQDAIMGALKSVADPNTHKEFAATRSLKNLQVADGDVSFDLELGYPAKSQHAAIRKALVAAARPRKARASASWTPTFTAPASP
jgi:ATP-binding protein involved in chromosome partitioning